MADPAYIVDGVLTDGEAWVGIAHASLSLPASTVTWTSTNDGQTGDFSQYMDLKIICNVRSSVANDQDTLYLKLNNAGVSGSYVWQVLYGNGSTVTATNSSGNKCDIGTMPANTATANVFSSHIIDLLDVNSGKDKFIMSLFGNTGYAAASGTVGFYPTQWVSAAAITEIDIFSNSSTLAAGSTFDLFGLLPRMVS
jgi:hypothetical protein